MRAEARISGSMRRALTAIRLRARSTGLQCVTQPQFWQWWNSVVLPFYT